MNCVYFACKTCELYLDAGYRWTQNLSGAVERGERVDVEKVLAVTEYWRGVEGDERLEKLLPQVRTFLEAHREHEIIFGEEEIFHHFDVPSLGWMEIETHEETAVKGAAVKAAIGYFWGPRYFAEKLAYTKWEQVVEHMADLAWDNWWFEDAELRFEGRRKFERYVRAKEK